MSGTRPASEALIPPTVFGHVDPELPLLLGQVVMLSALLEQKVAAIASSVDNKPQSHYWRATLQANVETCRERFPLFDTSPFEMHAIEEARSFIADVVEAAGLRNDLVHRVWSKAGLSKWGGYKALRSRVPSRRRRRASGDQTSTNWRDYSPPELREFVVSLVALVDRARDVLPLVGALQRRAPEGGTELSPERAGCVASRLVVRVKGHFRRGAKPGGRDIDSPAVYLFPYLRIRKTTNFGPWSLQPLDPAKVRDATAGLGATIRWLLARHRDHMGEPLSTAVLVQRTQPELEAGMDRVWERESLQAAVAFAVSDANAPFGNAIDWDRTGSDIATAEVAHFFVGDLGALEGGGHLRTRGGTINRQILFGGTVHDEFFVVRAPEGLVSTPQLDLDGHLLDAVYRVTLEGSLDRSLKIQNEICSALHWHSRAWENSPLHTMPDILVQLKTALEALSGTDNTTKGIVALEAIYAAVNGTLGEGDFLWRFDSPTFTNTWKGKKFEVSAFSHWFRHLAEARNKIVHATESPEMDYVAEGSPFEGNLFRVAERVTRELIKIRIAQLGYPLAALSPTNRKVLDFAERQGTADQFTLVAALESSF